MTELTAPTTVGGGTKKVLYTLQTLARIGLRDSTKALRSHNACKACGLGMGGQRGGMTNELDEFPSVCNKSIQAQSTDIQKAIPTALFDKHPISDFQELSGREIEHLGRLGAPIYKAAGASHYREISWDDAYRLCVEAMQNTPPQRSFFYSSGRSSNEAGFILQLFARLYGTNNINNCSYYCHQATSVALANTIGSGTATVELKDLQGCDLVFLIGANPASNHPRLIHKLKELRERGGKIIVINPAKEPGLVRFAVPKSPKSLLFGGTEIASDYLQPKIGSDLLLIKGIAKALLEKNAIAHHFITHHTHGFEPFRADIESTAWPEITAACGITQAQIEQVAEVYAQSQKTIFAWGMGMTHHLNGVENVEYIANLALLRAMVGQPMAGLLPLRGHSNVQGIGTIGVKPVLAEDVFHRIQEVFSVALPTEPGMDTLACLRAAHSNNIDFALMMGGNLFAASPERSWTTEALDRIGFKVFLTTTLNHGHVYGINSGASLVLPVTARDEEWQSTTQESMFNYVRLSDGGISRLEKVRPEGVILCDLAKQLLPDSGLDFAAFKTNKTIRAAIAATVPGLEALADIDVTGEEFHVSNRLLHTPQFNTEDGRARFVVAAAQARHQDKDFPFLLMTVRSEGQFNTIIYEDNDSYRGTPDRWSLLMNPQQMQAMQLQRGDVINLRSAHGRMDKVKVYPFDLPEHNLMAYFPEANVLIGPHCDPRSQTPAFKAVNVAIEFVLPG